MGKTFVCPSSQVPANGMVECAVEGGLKLLVANAGDEYFAYQAMCPHQDRLLQLIRIEKWKDPMQRRRRIRAQPVQRAFQAAAEFVGLLRQLAHCQTVPAGFDRQAVGSLVPPDGIDIG